MSVLRISLFGSGHIANHDSSGERKVTRTVRALLAYLLLYRQHTHSREVLAGLFWGDHSEAQARRCLRTTLWRLRAVLEPPGIARGTYLVSTAAGQVGFNWDSDYWLDTAEFENRAGRALARPLDTMTAVDARDLEEAVRLYTGELLEGIYDDWAIRERDRLRCLYLDGLSRLMQHHERLQCYDESLACGRRILVEDPLREEIHRAMMRLYVASGQRALAVRQYEACRNILAEELDVPPMEETEALYTRIVSTGTRRRPPSPMIGGLANPQQVSHQIRQAVRALDETREQLQRALRLLERLTEPGE